MRGTGWARWLVLVAGLLPPPLAVPLPDGGPKPQPAHTIAAIAAAAPGATAVTSYLQDPAHTDATASDLVAPPLTQAWSARFGGAVSYPLIVGNEVIVSTSAGWPNASPTTVEALDLSSGRVLWSVPMGSNSTAPRLAYDGGNVYVLDSDGLLHAYSAPAGQSLWQVNPAASNLGCLAMPPVATGGSVYVMSGCLGTLSAVNESTGALRWSVRAAAQCCGLAVDSGRVYIAGCYGSAAYSAANGTLLWSRSRSCTVNGSSAQYDSVAVLGTRLAVPGELLDPATGATLATFPPGDPPPAWSGGTLVIPHPGESGLSTCRAERPTGAPRAHRQSGHRSLSGETSSPYQTQRWLRSTGSPVRRAGRPTSRWAPRARRWPPPASTCSSPRARN